jgi:hypothetical protein
LAFSVFANTQSKLACVFPDQLTVGVKHVKVSRLVVADGDSGRLHLLQLGFVFDQKLRVRAHRVRLQHLAEFVAVLGGHQKAEHERPVVKDGGVEAQEAVPPPVGNSSETQTTLTTIKSSPTKNTLPLNHLYTARFAIVAAKTECMSQYTDWGIARL